jgi:hypothetical protein
VNRKLLASLLFLTAACAKQQSQLQTAALTPPYTDEEIIDLYHKADTIIRRNDSLLIVNTRRDTVIIETGIFPYLQYDYPLNTPYAPLALTRQAMTAEKNGNQAEAARYYQTVADYFQYQWLTRKDGFENGGFSDMNDLLAHNVNVRLLASNAYEKLGKLPEAAAVLSQYMANVEAEDSKIQQRYVELCIKRYGKAATRRALDTSGRTIRHAADEAPEKDYWCITLFGAPMSVVDFNTDTLTTQAVQQLVWQQPYYKLVM